MGSIKVSNGPNERCIRVGFWRSTFRVIGDVTSLGGTARIRNWTERQRELLDTYQRMCASINTENGEFQRAVSELKGEIRRSTALLRRAGKILDPLGQGRRILESAGHVNADVRNTALLSTRHLSDPTPKELAIVAGGATVGTGTAIAGWGAVQVVAHASTGTAMATLHGAAAANAGWAWFGGGSLAAGGGGMALGHLVLPGIGTAVAVTFASIVSHKEANRLADQCGEIGKTNSINAKTLATLASNSAKIHGWQRLIESEYHVLHEATRRARNRLFPLGILTKIWRLFRSWFGGEYYLPSELLYVEALDTAVLRFLDAFRIL
jgi:hypothetical protein